MEYSEALQAAKSAWYSHDISELFTYNGSPVYGHVEDAYERQEGMTRGVSFWILLQQSDVSDPAVGDVVMYGSIQYRVGTGFHPVGDDWLMPLVEDYAEI